MPIRIYALAKQLNIENKDLVDACTKAGIKGKGSALASLNDDEVVKIKAFLESNRKKPAAQATEDDPLKPVRPSTGQTGKRSIKVVPRSADAAAGRVGRSRFLTGVRGESSAQTVAEAPSATQTLAPPEESPLDETLDQPIHGPIHETSDEAVGETTLDQPEPAIDVEEETNAVTSLEEDISTETSEESDLSVATSVDENQADVAAEAPTQTVESPSETDVSSPETKPSPARPPLAQVIDGTSSDSPPEAVTDAASSSSVAAESTTTDEDDLSDAGQTQREIQESTPESAASSSVDSGAPRREPALAVASNKIKVLASSASKKAAGKRQEGDKSRQKRGPLVNLPKMPTIKKPVAKPAKEEKTQKPVMRLPKDAIAGHKKGKPTPLPLQDHLRKGEKGKTAPKKPGQPDANRDTADRAGRRRRGVKEGEPGKSITDLGSVRQVRRNKSTRAKRRRSDEDDSGGRRRYHRRPGPKKDTAKPRKGKVVLELPCTVRSFSEAAGIGAVQVLRTLMGLGAEGVNINAQVEPEMVELLALELGVELAYKQEEDLEESLVSRLEGEEDSEDALEVRPPVVTFLGHVDHGKTSLLDSIIGTNVVAGEAGGITQHIRAYQVDRRGRKIAFVDTPGHEAFTEMRARGANVTDIAVLVVAADDGVMPQTEEAISHAKAAEAPIVVALNKTDLPGSDPDRVLQQLAAHDLLPSEWGGETEVIKTSAITGDGIDDLLDTLLLTADIHEYKANPDRAGMGVCLEAEQEAERGVIAKMMVRRGTMFVGDVVVCGAAYGRVKAIYDTLKPRCKLEEAGPSTPVNITGLNMPPEAGDSFVVVPDIAQAREIAETRDTRTREQELSGVTQKISLVEFQRRLAAGEIGKTSSEDVVKLGLILRADTRGSIEAIEKELGKIQHPEIEVQIRQALVGGVTTADVTLADATDAVIIAFNVIPDEAARSLADARNVEIRRYEVIYKVADDIKATLEQRLRPEERVVELGRAIVLQTFSIGRLGVIAGCRVIDGTIERGCGMRVYRESRLIGEYPMESLRREKDDVKEVPRGMECGIKLSGFDDIKQDDVLEAYKIEEVARKL